ncbi:MULTISPECIES: hypothetical protein [Streptomyces]|uniref:Uncharacterized protein n=2 Tax=Streptomyces TaxID=1883 RepID=A0ABW6YYE5_9ACTN|nr:MULTISPECIES: hypothetical protein [Streptomyces]MCL3992235.1 hypothetical protein [Streptomyces lavenduligriseus]QIS73794.1 hypothetical protein HB370_30525 [Streptomyces sp. DSM 40868]WDM10354.1 hypothetical protein J3S85_01625 [Streptomyces lavenduligriseus]
METEQGKSEGLDVGRALRVLEAADSAFSSSPSKTELKNLVWHLRQALRQAVASALAGAEATQPPRP